MRKRKTQLLAAVLAAGLVLSGCGSSSDSGSQGGSNGGADSGTTATETKKADELTELYTYETTSREVETLFWLNSERAADFEVLCNLVDGLLETNNNGQLVPAIAEEWGTEDGGKTWTFKIREGVTWVDMNGEVKADCTAEDFVTGLEWVMNFHKNGSTNTSMPVDLIEGASEYYEYTKELDEATALSMDKSKFLEMVGIETPDEYTVVYTCTKPAPYFDTVAISMCLYPLSQAWVDEMGVENVLASTNEDLWYNGCYTITSYIHGNEKILTKNPNYWDTDAKLFENVYVKIVDSADVAFQLYQTGELDHVTLNESTLKTIAESDNSPYKDQLVEKRMEKYGYNMVFNFDKHLADGSKDDNWNKAIANTAFRQSWYYGLDVTPYLARSNAINPLGQEINTYTAKGAVKYADGSDYTDHVIEKLGLPESNGETIRRYDPDKAAEYKAQAIEELTAQGVTFPVTIDYYISGSSQTALDSATVLKQVFSQGLGDDYVVLNINTYVSSASNEVYSPRLQSFTINGWGADYADPQNFLGQNTYGNDGAYYSKKYSNINDATDETAIGLFKEFTELVEAADAVTDDVDKRYDAYVDAEVFWLENAMSIPMYQQTSWQLTHVNDYTKLYALCGAVNYKYKNIETSVDAYTTEQYEAFKAEVEG